MSADPIPRPAVVILTGDEALRAARETLISDLEAVRSAYDQGADDWEYRLLGAFRGFCRLAGIDDRLIDPIAAARMDKADALIRQREEHEARQAGKALGGAPRKPTRDALALTMAAAAVTVLKERGRCSSISDAEREVANLSGIDRKKVRAFRNSINSGTATVLAIESYQGYLQELRTWPSFETLGRLGGFLKNPRIN